MNEPLRLLTLKRLTALLETITPANGYVYDLTGSVFRGRRIFADSDPLPLISLLEGDSPDIVNVTAPFNAMRECDWLVVLQGWVSNDFANPSDPAYYLAAEVERCLAQVIATDRQGNAVSPDHYLLGIKGNGKPLITDFTIMPAVVNPPSEQTSSYAFFYMPLMIGLAEKVGSPYPMALV